MPHATIAPARKVHARRLAPARPAAVRQTPAPAPTWAVMPLWTALRTDGVRP